jgi:hypothetical protein
VAIAARGGLYDPAVGPLRNAMAARSRACAVLVFALLPLASCTNEPDPVPAACFGGPAPMLSALERAPGAVALGDGTRLSRCVSAARTDGDMQSLGLVFVRMADTLRAQAARDPAAALRLGYLAGAVKAGAAAGAAGITMQLARRVEQVATLEQHSSAAAAAALLRGRRAGERSG